MKISCICVVFALSIVGFSVPLCLMGRIKHSNTENAEKETSDWFGRDKILILKSFAAGVILGVALLHLLVESIEELEFISYPVGIVSMSFGIMLSIGIDQVALHAISNTENYVKREAHETAPAETCVDIERQCNSVAHPVRSRASIEHNQSKRLIKAYVLEAAIAVHSIIIGFGYGSLLESDYEAIKVLFVAFTFHQFLEGIGLGTVVSESEIDRETIIKFALFFSLTFPIGAIIGLCTETTSAGGVVQGLANGVAAGILVHSALVEMIMEDFMDIKLLHKPGLKLMMYVMVALGFGSMAVLAVWA